MDSYNYLRKIKVQNNYDFEKKYHNRCLSSVGVSDKFKKNYDNILEKLFYNDMKSIIQFYSSGCCYIIKTFAGLKQKSISKWRSVWQTFFITKLKKNKHTGNHSQRKYSFYDMMNERKSDFICSNIIFRPGYKSEYGECNLFQGYICNQSINENTFKYKYIKPFMDHLYNCWCDENQIHFDFIINWLCSILQSDYRNIKTKCALIIKSNEQQTGKGIICQFLVDHLFGKNHSTIISDINHISGKFNVQMSKKILTVLDECSNSGNRAEYFKTFDKFKSLITGNIQHLELKGQDVIEIEDYNNFIFLSNHDNPFRIEKYGDRCFVKTVSPRYRGNKKYFNKLYKNLQSINAAHLYYYLMNKDIRSFNPSIIPKTTEWDEMRQSQFDSFSKFLITYSEHFEAQILSKKEIIKEYNSWCCEYNIKQRSDPNINIIVKLFGKIIRKQIKGKKLRGYYFLKSKNRILSEYNIKNLEEWEYDIIDQKKYDLETGFL